MSLYSAMSTSLSGMNAQATRLATVGDNVSNATTTGYKKATTSFASMVANQGSSGYTSGGVTSAVRYSIATQGNISFSTSSSDLAIQGTGFFVVRDANGDEYLTRAGSFQYDSLGNLASGGYGLVGESFETPGVRGPIQVDFSKIDAAPSENGRITGNLNVLAEAVVPTGTGTAPSINNINPAYSFSSRVSDPSATADIYYTKIGANQWEVTAYFDSTHTATGFPYDMTQAGMSKMSTVLTFDPVTGARTNGNPILQPDPANPFSVDLSQFTQTAAGAPNNKFNAQVNFPSDFPVIDPAISYPASANQNTGAGPSFYSVQRLDGFTGPSAGLELDVYYSKTGPNQWEIAVFDRSLSTAGGFPYGAAGSAPLATTSLSFDPASRTLTSPGLMSVNLPSGDVMQLDFANSQSWDALAAPFADKVTAAMNLNPTTAVQTPTYVTATPSLNLANSVFTSKTSIIAYNGVGGTQILDVYYTKTPDNKWEVAVFDQSQASANGFPYAGPALASGQIEFHPVTGRAVNNLTLQVQVPNGVMMNLDFGGTTQLASAFNITDAKVDGRKASTIQDFVFGSDGTLSAVYGNGHIEATHRLLLASVTSPDKLTVLDNTLYQANFDSGEVAYGYPTEDFYGRLMSGALEGSNVDIADEFTNMIETQRVYAANSKTFQTSAEMLEILTNMKR